MNNKPKPINVPSVYGIPVGLLSRDEAEKAQKLVQLQAQIRSKVESGILGNIYIPKVVDKPKPLILDEYGRTVDSTGKTVQLETVAPTLKANLRNRKKNEMRSQERQSLTSEKTKTFSGTAILSSSAVIDSDSQYFDTRIEQKPAVRLKRQLEFNEPGKYVELAERQRKKIKLEKLQNEISQIAKKTGISSATKLALIAKAEPQTEGVPEVEWWDSVILTNNYDTLGPDGKISIKESAITSLVEHPVQVRPLFETSRSAVLPVFLTKKERKKMRQQKRREAYNEAQEKIRLGLEPAPEPKLRISNLMRVLSTEAVQDPTKIEALVREQMARRQKTHEEANAARKLTKEQRRDKKIRKLKEDTTLGVHVTVYRIRDLSIEMAAKKFKIETNAKQLFMTGILALYPDCCVVVVEGGPKQQRKYKRLMLERIKWDEDDVRDPDGNLVPNSCVLVWQGTVTKRNFSEFKYKVCESEKVARELFRKHRVEHYWDQAYSGAVLDDANDF